jgi:hypothetical protein
MSKTLRKQVPFHHDDEEALEHLRTENSPQAVALAVLTGIDIKPDSSDAETLHALIVAGRKVTEQAALEEAYRREAHYARNHPDVLAWRAAMRGRRFRSASDTRDSTSA